jgi:hypothetical protein
VFFVPPAGETLGWTTDYRWKGLWEALRTEGRDEGSLTVRPDTTEFTASFLFPRGIENPQLTIDSPVGLDPDVALSEKDGRKLLTWRVPPGTETIEYIYSIQVNLSNRPIDHAAIDNTVHPASSRPLD